MHELGYAIELIRTLDQLIEHEKIKEVREVTLTVGEATGIVPKLLHNCWPAAIDDNQKLKNCKLIINMVKTEAECNECHERFPLISFNGRCPKCHSYNYKIIVGTEFEITEIKVV
ncbi:MAG: hydrogenase maturation nickel metallochaperone HypA [Bacilli bacterium]|nr:hydrogenase maturation nickel metallochaperone HypA [Bacilli bacterium]